MPCKSIQQATTEDSLFGTLADWCKDGAGKRTHSLRILTAFASGRGVLAISPLLDIFLADGNSVQIIFGTDMGGTDRSAVQHLYALQKAHAKQIEVKLFKAPAAGSIFHPKLYVYEASSHVNFVMGSANLTSGGLGSNLESLLLWEGVKKNTRLAREILGIWKTYAQPSPPLSPSFLRQLTKGLSVALVRTLPVRTRYEPPAGEKRVKALWRPLSRTPLPRSERILPRRPISPKVAKGSYLVMDVLKETRNTQMQIPLAVVEQFFGIAARERATFRVSIWTANGLTQPIARPLVISTGIARRRLMRRLEMPEIKRLRRPLSVAFVQLRGKRRFAYMLFARGTPDYRAADRLLAKHGQQGKATRRYLIGHRGDSHWRTLARLLSSK